MAMFSSRLLRHEFCVEELRKIGAEVIDIEGVLFHVQYKLKDFSIEYFYRLNNDNTYVLERIKPYTLIIGEYSTEEAVVENIKNDIEQFKNAQVSKNFENFVSIDKDLLKIARYFEDLYLYYNVSKEDVQLLKSHITDLMNLILEIKEKSKRVYHKTEPYSFPKE